MKSFNIGNLEIKVPIIQGGMGIGISLSNLASAVANMGGVGVISTVGLGFIKGDENLSFKKNHVLALREEIRLARQKTKGVLGVNIMSVITNYADTVKAAIDEGIDIIFSGAGLPLDLPKYLCADKKTALVPIISSPRAANIICNKWQQNYNYLPDAFVIEGPKAGGHLGFKKNDITSIQHSLEEILDGVLEVTRSVYEKTNKFIPVIAAGGIFNGSDIFNIMKKGATGVQMGTRFVATDECDADPLFKQEFVNASQEDVQIITSPVGLPGRTIYNDFLRETDNGERKPSACRYHCIKTCNPKTTPYCIADALIQAYKGNMKDGFAFSGTNVGRVKEIFSVEKLINGLKHEYQLAKSKFFNNQ
jgi:nitronate monooxygenase